MSRDLVPEDIYEYTELRDVAVSPDGERVAFVAHGFDESEDRRRRGLFVAPVDGSRDPHRLTRASDAASPSGPHVGELASDALVSRCGSRLPSAGATNSPGRRRSSFSSNPWATNATRSPSGETATSLSSVYS